MKPSDEILARVNAERERTSRPLTLDGVWELGDIQRVLIAMLRRENEQRGAGRGEPEPVDFDYTTAAQSWDDLPESIKACLERASFTAGYNHAGVEMAIARQGAEPPSPVGKILRCEHGVHVNEACPVCGENSVQRTSAYGVAIAEPPSPVAREPLQAYEKLGLAMMFLSNPEPLKTADAENYQALGVQLNQLIYQRDDALTENAELKADVKALEATLEEPARKAV